MTTDYLTLDSTLPEPLYQQLTSAIRRAVEQGFLPPNAKMPSIRRLSEDLHISRTTVEAAYQQLCVEGVLHARAKSGYYVRFVQTSSASGAVSNPLVVSSADSCRIRYDFGTGAVDPEINDRKLWQRQIRNILNRPEIIASYGDPQGERALRQALAAYSYTTRGVLASPDQIVVGAGTQPLLYLLCGLLPEQRIVLSKHGFPQAERVFHDCGFVVDYIPDDGGGISMEALRSCGAHQALVSPSHPVANGSALPFSRRLELLEWARETNGFLLEDDYNGELRYNARPIPAMQGAGSVENMIYLGSFSKLLLPSVRIGYMVLPARLLLLYQSRRKDYNQTASKIEQLALSGYIADGQMERHLRRLRKKYAAKSALLAQCLETVFGDAVQYSLRETGLYFILSVKAACSAQELVELAGQDGIRITATACNSPPAVRLGFSGIPFQDIPPAVSALCRVWRKVLTHPPLE